MLWRAKQKGKQIEMKQLFSFIKKEFLHVFRDRKSLLMLFGLPVAQIILFGFALTNEIKNAKIVIADYSRDVATRQIIDKIEASEYFDIDKSLKSRDEIEEAFKEGKIKLAIIFPENFNNDLTHLNKAQVQIIADASDINTANTLSNYVNAIVLDYQRLRMGNAQLPITITPEIRMLYNPELKGEYNFVFDEIAAVKEACGQAHLKVILETGELSTLDNVRKASDLAMYAGGDFIKTSTGKVQPAATLPVTLVMLEAIRDFYYKEGKRIGMKPAGGIATAKLALNYLVMLRETLGNDWLTPDLFRFGASSLANDVLMQLMKEKTGVYQSIDYFSKD